MTMIAAMPIYGQSPSKPLYEINGKVVFYKRSVMEKIIIRM